MLQWSPTSLKENPQADLNGDGTLTREEARTHRQQARRGQQNNAPPVDLDVVGLASDRHDVEVAIPVQISCRQVLDGNAAGIEEVALPSGSRRVLWIVDPQSPRSGVAETVTHTPNSSQRATVPPTVIRRS